MPCAGWNISIGWTLTEKIASGRYRLLQGSRFLIIAYRDIAVNYRAPSQFAPALGNLLSMQYEVP